MFHTFSMLICILNIQTKYLLYQFETIEFAAPCLCTVGSASWLPCNCDVWLAALERRRSERPMLLGSMDQIILYVMIACEWYTRMQVLAWEFLAHRRSRGALAQTPQWSGQGPSWLRGPAGRSPVGLPAKIQWVWSTLLKKTKQKKRSLKVGRSGKASSSLGCARGLSLKDGRAAELWKASWPLCDGGS